MFETPSMTSVVFSRPVWHITALSALNPLWFCHATSYYVVVAPPPYTTLLQMEMREKFSHKARSLTLHNVAIELCPRLLP